MVRKKGFTLIELLIVVAIIGILAAIAIPNFLQAQVRAKAAKAVSELRTIATALEIYYVDQNNFPFDGANCSNSVNPFRPYWYINYMLTTPIEYISSDKLMDPFREHWYEDPSLWAYQRYRYQNVDDTWGRIGPLCWGQDPAGYYPNMLCLVGHWALHSLGPNRYYGPTGYPNSCDYPDWPLPYDPTNGTISDGNIMRTQRDASFESR